MSPDRTVLLAIPHYNDTERLGPFLSELLDKLPSRFEIVVSDDGSLPSEQRRLREMVGEFRGGRAGAVVRAIFATRNTGKGGAVRRAWDTADPSMDLAFVDADGAVSAAEFLRAEDFFVRQELHGVLFGSRVKMLGRTVNRSLTRHLTGRVFATLVSILGEVPAYDTQCGLKIIRRSAWDLIRPHQMTPGFAFDVELCLLCRAFGVGVVEFPVDWTDVPGSKVRLLRDSQRMALEVVRIRRRLQNLPSRPV